MSSATLSINGTRFPLMKGRRMTAKDTTPLLKTAGNLDSTQIAVPTS